ncbi:MAG: hypothetical protein IT555_18285 [Acetobacteraceae bacterium]|nr:hypothetical protein [Acetobacteraceae bacterium]
MRPQHATLGQKGQVLRARPMCRGFVPSGRAGRCVTRRTNGICEGNIR